jgi:hypothetical protein
MESLSVVVAWVRFRGVARLKPELEAFRERAHSLIILGLDEGGATRPGLFAALRGFSDAYVYHAPEAGTFHPKVYLAEGPSKASLFVGSTNMTPGGLYFNDEASLEAEFALPRETDEPALRDARAYIHRLLADTTTCRPLTEELIEELSSDPRYRVSGHERRGRKIHRDLPPGAEEDDIAEDDAPDVEGSAGEPIFGRSIRGRPHVPPLSQEALAELRELEIGYPESTESTPAAIATPSPLAPQLEPEEEEAGTLGFWKTLSAFDASDSSAPGQIIIPIRFIDFFPPLTVQQDERATGGSRQSDTEFALTFRDGPYTKEVVTGRAILYEPASNHPRPNKELRFTFRDHAVFGRLQKDDVLVFRHADDGRIVVRRAEPGSMGTGRFGALP